MSEQSDSKTPQRARKRRPGQRLNSEERKQAQEIFLQAFATTANVRAACLKAGIARSTVYEWAEHDEIFSLQYKQAELDANDLIREELFRRAVQGYEKPVVSMGRQVFVAEKVDGKKVNKPLMERIYSDTLLSLLAKARMPEFREKQHLDVTNTNAQDMQAIHAAIAKALEPYPDAKVALADALEEVEKARGSR